MSEIIDPNAEIQRERYNMGDLVFKQGDDGRHLYIVESGTVEIFTKDKEGGITQVAIVNSGESFGEFSLLDHKPRSASARALCESVVVKVSEAGYEQMLEELPVWATCMMKSFVARLRSMNHLIESSSQFLKK